MVRRNNPIADRSYYDVFSGKRGNQARGCFRKLAVTLSEEKIEPKVFLTIMATYVNQKYGKMPLPNFLCSEKSELQI